MHARTTTIIFASLAALALSATGCGRYSYRIRRDVDGGRYNLAAARCQSDGYAAAQRWGAQHEARYHVYCGIAYLNLGDTERAQSELVRAEKMRLDNPGLIRGRDLAKLSGGLVRLFGVPAGQLEIEVRPGQVAEAPTAEAPAPQVTIVPPAAPEPPAPPVTNAPSVSLTAGGGVSAGATVRIGAPRPPVVTVTPVPPAPPAVEVAPPPPPAEAAPPVYVIPEEDAAVIE